MNDAIPEPADDNFPIVADTESVARVKAAWRKHAASPTWQEKVAAIEGMRERDAVLRHEREALRAAQTPAAPSGVKSGIIALAGFRWWSCAMGRGISRSGAAARWRFRQ